MRLALGTVQFGKKYGISNQGEQTSLKEAKNIIDVAKKNGIELFDTASSYGTSEKILGKILLNDTKVKIVTKTPYLKIKKISPYYINIFLTKFFQSLENLQRKQIYGLLIHNPENLLIENSHLLYKELLILKRLGKIQNIGVSVYEAREIDEITKKYDLDLIQLPINILDQRLIKNGCLRKLKKKGVEIHARSVFLQGLLLMPLNKIPAYFNSIIPTLKKLHIFLRNKNIKINEAAIGFIKNISEIDYILIGVNNSEQINSNIDAYHKEINFDFNDFSFYNDEILNPSKWK